MTGGVLTSVAAAACGFHLVRVPHLRVDPLALKRVTDPARGRTVYSKPQDSEPYLSMKTRTLWFLVIAAVGTVMPVVSAAAASMAVAVSSNTVAVHQPELKNTAQGWRLAGCLAPQRGTRPGATTHLDVAFLDAAGAELAVRTEPLAASLLRERPRRPRPHLRYELTLGALPAGTCRIEVRAHQQTDSQK